MCIVHTSNFSTLHGESLSLLGKTIDIIALCHIVIYLHCYNIIILCMCFAWCVGMLHMWDSVCLY